MAKFDSNTAKQARAKAAGRGENKIKAWIKDAVNKEETIEVFKKLTDMAKKGDMDAIKTYLAYVIGKPKDTVELTTDPENPVKLILDARFKDATGDNS